MIFNPFNLTQLTTQAQNPIEAVELSWAAPLLQDNVLVVGLVLGFFIIDILACYPSGVLQHQLDWVMDTRNSRTFESQMIVFPWIKPLLLMQLFTFVGLSLFCLFDSSPAQHLHSLADVTWSMLGACMAIFLSWYLVQKGVFNWFCYLFKLKDKKTIMNRTYQAAFMLLAPFSMVIFILLMAGLISHETTIFLLAALFIFSQIAFILNGFKIFYEGIGSILLIFAYLCTLEIAPIVVIWAKITT